MKTHQPGDDDFDRRFRHRVQEWCNIAGVSSVVISNRCLNRGSNLPNYMAGKGRLSVRSMIKILVWMDANPPHGWRKRNPLGRPAQPHTEKEQRHGQEG